MKYICTLPTYFIIILLVNHRRVVQCCSVKELRPLLHWRLRSVQDIQLHRHRGQQCVGAVVVHRYGLFLMLVIRPKSSVYERIQGNQQSFRKTCALFRYSEVRGVPAYAAAFDDTHCTYPRRVGQAELNWAAGCTQRWFDLPTTHPNTKRSQDE